MGSPCRLTMRLVVSQPELLYPRLTMSTANAKRVAIIGGGIAGVGAAWALKRSGFPVQLFEKTPALGGNAKTFKWDFESKTVESPLLVVAWPTVYYRNYKLLLDELGIETTEMPIQYFVNTAAGVFNQEEQTPLHQRMAPHFAQWKRMLSWIERVNNRFLPRDRWESLYHFSYFNPLNLISLYRVARLFGIPREFWDEIFVTVHASTFITTKMDGVPAVIGPLLENVVPLEHPCRMSTWTCAPREVFEAMTADLADHVHTGHEITKVRGSVGGFAIEDSQGRQFEADEIVYACDAPSVLRTMESPSWMESALLGNIEYVTQNDPTFANFVVHSDASIIPAEHREVVTDRFQTYIEVDESGDLEATFVLSAGWPGLKEVGQPMLATFNSKKSIDKVQQRIELPNANHSLNLKNMLIMAMMRHVQGRRGFHYCGTYTTPESGHDLSFLSGLVVANAIGAPYPFPDAHEAAGKDFQQIQRLMLGTNANGHASLPQPRA